MRRWLRMWCGPTELRAGLWCWARSGLRGRPRVATGRGGVVRVVRGCIPDRRGSGRGMGARTSLRRSRRVSVGDRPRGVHRRVFRALGRVTGSHHSGRARRERYVEVDGFRPELSCFASGRFFCRYCAACRGVRRWVGRGVGCGLVDSHSVDFGGRRRIDDVCGADGLFALARSGIRLGGVSLLRIGAERLLILRVLGGLLTHSNNATGAAGSRTARRPPTPRRVFPTPCDRGRCSSRWTLELHPRTSRAVVRDLSAHPSPFVAHHLVATVWCATWGEGCRSTGRKCRSRYVMPSAIRRPQPLETRRGAAPQERHVLLRRQHSCPHHRTWRRGPARGRRGCPRRLRCRRTGG